MNPDTPTPQAEEGVIEIVLGPHSPLLCTECGDSHAPQYVLVRRRGLYAALCFRGGPGCYERSGRVLCKHTAPYGAQCMNLEEFEIVAPDGQRITTSCAEHLATLIPPGSDEVRIFPLD